VDDPCHTTVSVFAGRVSSYGAVDADPESGALA
jgi:hypothetical protein